jgi:hypothetical protein
MIKSIGIDTDVFKAHSERGAAVSKANSKGVPTNIIMDTANWSSVHVFTKFYKREIPLVFADVVVALKLIV